MRLTPTGQRLADHAVSILAAVDAARLDLDPDARARTCQMGRRSRGREEAIPQPDDPPPRPFSPADPGIAAVDWISVDENGYLVVQAKAGWGDDPADIALLAELHEEARTSRPPTPGEIAYDEAHEAISALWDALAHQERREYNDYAEQLTSAVHARLAALNLPTPGHREHHTRPRGRPLRRLRRPPAGHAPTQRDRGGDPRHDRQHADPIGVAGHSPRSARRAAARRIVTSPTSTVESPVSRAGRLRPRRCRLDTGPGGPAGSPLEGAGALDRVPGTYPHPVERICSTLLA